ncbi:LOW QUALITY PROTEIN: electrogenic sodium bicarbonate cotransporter 1-like [Paramacrobiotus metropolitanus]|uniref:LOW QUALITY PROTEIN: electrogenic sodium bicarbonate cotransporter 1-like n=1 Tax=Paramacrobiotus metropolitanus TaxID=2943436 RepID=UPI0024458F71|nr:LOW QUALITY PROTEIN: electrogenic sodium bicarbonate cotransporter 1-like [Paramacrobiotus metropolitanus]
MEPNFGKDRSRTNSTITTHGIKFKLGDDTGQDAEDHLHKDKHTLFCEMTELKFNKKRGAGGEPEWRETARWVKFEEDVEEGGNRWSKPFVASLSLHSLLELRNHFTTGLILLDLDASNLHELWTEVIQQWVNSGCLPDNYRDAVLGTLLQRPKHLNQRRMRKIGSKDQDSTKTRSFSQLLRNSSSNLLERNDSGKDSGGLPSNANLEGLTREESRANIHFLKKLPTGTEAANILVAELDFLPPFPLCAFVRLSRPTFLGSLTEVPVPTRYLFVLLGPKAVGDRYHQIGRTMGTLFSDELFQQVIYKAKDREDILSATDDFLGASTVLPPGEWDPKIRIEPPACVQSQESRMIDKLRRTGSTDVLQALESSEHSGKSDHGAGIRRTGRLFGGFVDDIKRKIPFYVSDFKDALHIQCLASFIFLYFASMTPLITFGGLMSDLLKRRMGAVETILARAFSGIAWGLTAGQPMVILGSTGPILVFELISFNMCESMDIDYLPMRLWIGIWATILLLLMVVFDLSSLVSYITRFTEESFAALVSAIFVYEAFKKLFHIAEEEPLRTNPGIISNTSDICDCVIKSPVNNYSVHIPIDANFSKEDCTKEKNATAGIGTAFFGDGCTHYVPDAFLLSVVLFFGTYFMARTLKDFKVSPFFTNKLRQFVSDFAVIISIGVFVGVDYALGIPTPKLGVPDQLEPTYTPRGGSWIVPFFGDRNQWWTAIAAVLPGILVTILIFMDQQITTVIINRKENRFRKGIGYHLDLFVVSVLTLISSFLGMPWMVADTVLSLTHVASLRMESEVAAPGERPTFLGVREQRITNIAISIVIGASIFMTSFLRIIPMPVLFGVFLFMGLNALNGLQFTDRLKLAFMPLKYQPDYAYLRHVKIKRVHLYTFIQLLCLVFLWLLKSFLETAMLFPLMVGALVGVRKLMDYVFTQYELSFLDDIMPENVKRKKEDVQKDDDEKTITTPTTVDENFMKICLPNGNVLSIPVKKNHSSVSQSSEALDFTSAVNKTGLWKNISSANLLSQVNEMEEYRSRETSNTNTLELPKSRKRRTESTRTGDQDGLSPVPDGSDVESDPMLQMEVPPPYKEHRST